MRHIVAGILVVVWGCTGAAPRGETEEGVKRAAHAEAARVRDIDIENIPLDEALEYLAAEKDVRVSYAMVSTYRKDPPEPPRISIHRKEATVDEILAAIMSQAPGYVMLRTRGTVTILPKDWKQDPFLNMKVDLVKKDAFLFRDIIFRIIQMYREKYGVEVIEDKKTFMMFGGFGGKESMRINILVSQATVLDVLQFLSEIDENFTWSISKDRWFSYDISTRDSAGKEPEAGKEKQKGKR